MKHLLTLFFLICSSLLIGQNQGNIWYFGDSAGVDFNGSTPTAIVNGQLGFPLLQAHNEGSSVISDDLGALLFYSDGMTIWNKNHQIMQNGSGLLGNFSSTQSSIIVPQPNSNQYYYIFTTSTGLCCGSNITDGLRYSKIDLCADSGFGEVLFSEKNILLVDTVTEKIAVTRHSNGIDYWLLTHKYSSNQFWAMKVTSTGIIDTIMSSVGSIHGGTLYATQGQLKISPNGQKIVLGGTNGLDLLELFDFDNTSGIVSNFQPLDRIDNGSVYGVEFSSNSSIVYAMSSSISPFGMYISQYDITSGNLSTINASRNSIFNATTIVTGRGLQIGPDGKIYSVGLLNPQTLSVINNPNIYGLGCNFQSQSISLNNKSGSYSLPSFITGFDYSNEIVSCNVGIDELSSSSSINIYPNPASGAISMTLNESRSGFLRVLNFLGQVVLEEEFKATRELNISLDGPSGLYFIQLEIDGKMITKKVVKE